MFESTKVCVLTALLTLLVVLANVVFAVITSNYEPLIGSGVFFFLFLALLVMAISMSMMADTYDVVDRPKWSKEGSSGIATNLGKLFRLLNWKGKATSLLLVVSTAFLLAAALYVINEIKSFFPQPPALKK
jgi:hypothetical protein